MSALDFLLSSRFTFHPSDPAWPECLFDLQVPPRRLRVAGQLPFLDRAVAIVGTRRATGDGLALAAALAAGLARAGYVVVSGGAEGIDAAAHRGALEAGGLGIAVLAGGLDRLYPPRHRPLFEAIAQNGAVVTEAEDDEVPRPERFLSRNRLIAALCRAVVVVQAPERSGALSTAEHARRLGRPLFAMPWAIGDVRSAGGLALLAAGACVCRDAADIAFALSGERVTARRARGRPAARVDAQARAVLEALPGRGAHADELARATGIAVAQLQSALTTLTLLGLVVVDPHGLFRRAAG